MTTAVATPVVPHVTPSPMRWVARVARWSLLVFAIAAVGVVAWRVVKSHRTSPVHYQTARVDHGPLSAKVTATGTLSALVTVSPGK